jgi:hypothetical protein
MRTALFWVITQLVVVFSYQRIVPKRRFPLRNNPEVDSSQEFSVLRYIYLDLHVRRWQFLSDLNQTLRYLF